MLPRGYPTQDCSIARTLEVIGERWTLLIVREAILGARRFEQFRNGLHIAPNVLTTRLERLTDDGVLERRRYQDRPERYEYTLTAKGMALAPVLFHLMKWGDRYAPSDKGAPMTTRHRDCGGQVDAELSCDRCLQRVEFDDVELVRRPEDQPN